MIVNYTEHGWEIITQRAHGLLAAQAAMHWCIKDRPERWAETLLAIADHDDAQIELEEEEQLLLTEAGGPMNFNMRLYNADHCRRLLDFSLSKSRYIALLTSMHMVFLYKKEMDTNPQVKPFINKQLKYQQTWRAELNITEEEAQRIYGLMEWCDAFSLLLCRQEVQPEQRSIQISTGPDQRQYQLLQLTDDALTVEPWPFESHEFKVHVETRLIPQLQFKNAADFKAAFLVAAVKEKEWQLKLKK